MDTEPARTKCQVLPFPPDRSYRLVSTVNLLHLDGHLFATAGFLPGNPGDAWAWIQETVARELECSEENVGCGEPDSDAGFDTVTVDGLPVYMVEIVRPRAFAPLSISN